MSPAQIPVFISQEASTKNGHFRFAGLRLASGAQVGGCWKCKAFANRTVKADWRCGWKAPPWAREGTKATRGERAVDSTKLMWAGIQQRNTQYSSPNTLESRPSGYGMFETPIFNNKNVRQMTIYHQDSCNNLTRGYLK